MKRDVPQFERLIRVAGAIGIAMGVAGTAMPLSVAGFAGASAQQNKSEQQR